MEKVFETALGVSEKQANGEVARSVSSSGVANDSNLVYNEEQYNNFGWAVQSGALMVSEVDHLYHQTISKKSLKFFPQDRYGRAIVVLDSLWESTGGASPVVAIVDGVPDDPSIVEVYRTDFVDYDEIKKLKKRE